MNINQFKLNNNGKLSIQTGSGKSIIINSNDVNNREIIRGVLNSRLDFINPQIGMIKKKFTVAVSMTPIEQAEYDYLQERVLHLEKEKTSLLGIVNVFKTYSGNPNQPSIATRSKLDTLKIRMKSLVKESNIKDLYPIVDQNVSQDSSLYNQFITVFSSFGRLNSEHSTGRIPREDFTISLAQISFSLLSLIDDLKTDDLKT